MAADKTADAVCACVIEPYHDKHYQYEMVRENVMVGFAISECG